MSSYSEAGDNRWETDSEETSPPPSVGSVNSTSKKAINRGRWTKDEVTSHPSLVLCNPSSLPFPYFRRPHFIFSTFGQAELMHLPHMYQVEASKLM